MLRSVRTWVLRHLARRFHIGEDILAHLSSFQRLGEYLEIDAPSEMLPVGARTLVRALRSRAAPQIRPDWLWPYWMEQQLDPRSESFVPRGHLAVLTNLTHRNWTALGNPWSAWEAIVDPRGLVTPWFDGWSLDWWVEVAGEWHFPSRSSDVRQRLRGGAPVVDTTMTVPGANVTASAYAQWEAALPGREAVVIEIGNDSDRPLRIAFALRPYNPEGLAVLSDLKVHGDEVRLQHNELALLLPGTPTAQRISTYEGGDVANHLRAGDLTGPVDAAIHDPAGLAQAAFVYVLAPGESRRAAAPLLPGDEQRSHRRGNRRVPVRSVTLHSAQTAADAWAAPIGRGLNVTVPDPRLQEALAVNKAYQLLLHDPGSITPGPFTYHRFWFRDAAYQVVALDRWGLHAEAADVLRSFPQRQRADGFFYSQWREWDANGAAIWSIAEHHRLTRDDTLLEDLAPSAMKGARWITRVRGRNRPERPELHGLLPAGVSAEHLGPHDYYYWDDFWALRGLRDAAYIAHHLGDARTAREFEQDYVEFRRDILASIEKSVERIGVRAIPAGPSRGIDAGMIGSLAACSPLGLLDASNGLVLGTADVIRDRFCLGSAFFQGISHTGLGTYLTLQLASVELETGDPRAWERFQWLLDAATPTWTWPEAIHPQLPGGCMGDGHHGWASADMLSFARNALVREDVDGGLTLLSLLPAAWRGATVAVSDAPTHHGHISFTLRWEDDQPVLEWECERPGVMLRAPSLDPAWSTTERSGRMGLQAVSP